MKRVMGCVFDIERYSIQDGPGIRSTVFFKGCPLRCLWCANPESQQSFLEVIHKNSLCNKCGDCLQVCEVGALSIDAHGVKIDRKKCTNCGKCITVCPTQALSFFGREMLLDDVIREVERDTAYYRSDGGVTASGGEPCLQADFLVALFHALQRKGIHTALDTCGYASPSVLAEVLKYTDLVLYDLKHMDSAIHKSVTEVPNELILENARMIVERGIPVIFRIPVIPGINDSEEQIRTTCEFVLELKDANEIDLLPYHRLGISKYEMLDRSYKLGDRASSSPEHVEKLKTIIEDFGLSCRVGG